MADIRENENERESWYATNNSSNNINIGDLPLVPTIVPVRPWNLLNGIPDCEEGSVFIATLSPVSNFFKNWFTVDFVFFLYFCLVPLLCPFDFPCTI